ncbi:MAG TPA: class I SAM-dependent methyltransferase [Pseudonocardiaceae bacterium]
MAVDELKRRQSQVWGTGSYELLPQHYSPLLDHLTRALAVQPGERVLDVACGTGALTTRLAASGAEVRGVDLAPALVETARRLAAEDGTVVHYDVGDAEDLPYPDGTFDVVASSVGTMFAPTPEAVARELARVCRPGRRLGLANWSAEHGVVDMFGIIARFQPPPPAGVPSPFRWGSRERCDELLGEAFELSYQEGDAPQRGSSGEEVWQLFLTTYGPVRTLAGALDTEHREELHRAFVDFFEHYRVGGEVHQPRPYLLVLGTRRS